MGRFIAYRQSTRRIARRAGLVTRVNPLASVPLGVLLEFSLQYILELVECVVNALGSFSNDRFVGCAPQYRVTWLVECIVFYLPKKTREHRHDLQFRSDT